MKPDTIVSSLACRVSQALPDLQNLVLFALRMVSIHMKKFVTCATIYVDPPIIYAHPHIYTERLHWDFEITQGWKDTEAVGQ